MPLVLRNVPDVRESDGLLLYSGGRLLTVSPWSESATQTHSPTSIIRKGQLGREHVVEFVGLNLPGAFLLFCTAETGNRISFCRGALFGDCEWLFAPLSRQFGARAASPTDTTALKTHRSLVSVLHPPISIRGQKAHYQSQGGKASGMTPHLGSSRRHAS